MPASTLANGQSVRRRTGETRSFASTVGETGADPSGKMAEISYTISDAFEEMDSCATESAALVHLDDACARPERNGGFGVEYPTHCFSDDDDHFDEIDSDRTVVEMLDHCHRVLKPGGVLLAEADAWLLPRLTAYLSREWGEYSYGIGGVTALNNDGEPDKSTPGMYLSNGGYSFVLATKAACPVGFSLNFPTPRQREQYGWGTVKPLWPYEVLLEECTTPGDRILEPCAGTAPVAIAAEKHDLPISVDCFDIEPEAKAAYERRREDELEWQATFGNFDA